MAFSFSGTEDWVSLNPSKRWRKVAFQGMPGAYAHLAITSACPGAEAIPHETFDQAIQAVEDGDCDGVVVPVENSSMGRIADIHTLLPKTHLRVVGEHYQPVAHGLLALPGTQIETLTSVYSQVPALQQCKGTLNLLGLTMVPYADTAGAAKMVAEKQDRTMAALASALAAEVYGLEVVRMPMNDYSHNTTRFWLLGREGWRPKAEVTCKTTIFFGVRHMPAALYKALSGFATNGVNLSRLESYLLGAEFEAAEFFIDIKGHPDQPAVNRALEELKFFTSHMRLLGIYEDAGVASTAVNPT